MKILNQILAALWSPQFHHYKEFWTSNNKEAIYKWILAWIYFSCLLIVPVNFCCTLTCHCLAIWLLNIPFFLSLSTVAPQGLLGTFLEPAHSTVAPLNSCPTVQWFHSTVPKQYHGPTVKVILDNFKCCLNCLHLFSFFSFST